MSIVPFPSRSVAPHVDLAARYYQTDRRADRVVKLRPMSAIEQMYAYWGSDRV